MILSKPQNLPRFALMCFTMVLLVMTLVASFYYPGRWYIYLAFSLVSNYFLLAGFNKNAIFFDTFIGVFFWLGFWLKTTFKLIFFDGVFKEAVGQFNGSGNAFDRALVVVMVAFIGLSIARWIRLKWMYTYRHHQEQVMESGLFEFYAKHRNQILALFVLAVLAIGISNAYFGFYQRGEIPKTILPFGLNGIYTWLLLFGLASISALILRVELALSSGKLHVVSIIALFEVFVSNVSLLSRGMLLNVFALFYGLYRLAIQAGKKINLKKTVLVSVIFIVLFGASVMTVNYLRYSTDKLNSGDVEQTRNDHVKTAQTSRIDQTPDPVIEKRKLRKAKNAKNKKSHAERARKRYVDMTSRLFIDRWVGMEGVLAIASSSKLGWDLFGRALREKYSHHETSFYDLNLIKSPYIKTDKSKHHFISLPGAIAFFFYPGSYVFLFVAMVLIGLSAALIELCAYRLGGGNLILCALMSQVIAFRLASFGYVPSQTYLLIGTIFLNLLMIYGLNHVLNKYYRPLPDRTPER